MNLARSESTAVTASSRTEIRTAGAQKFRSRDPTCFLLTAPRLIDVHSKDSVFTPRQAGKPQMRGVNNRAVPNQRSRTQRLVNFPASEEFIRELDAALPQVGYGNRSEFIRDAVEEKLASMGFQMSDGVTSAPMRTKKRPNQGSPEAAPKGPQSGVPPTGPSSSHHQSDPDEATLRAMAQAGVLAAGLAPGEGSPTSASTLSPIDNRSQQFDRAARGSSLSKGTRSGAQAGSGSSREPRPRRGPAVNSRPERS